MPRQSNPQQIRRATRMLRDQLQDGSSLDLRASDAELDQQAKQTGAVIRWKKISNARTLIRLALIWAVVQNMSLRTTSAWALKNLDLDISDSALGQRFSKLEPLLQSMIMNLASFQVAPERPRVVLSIVDGSSLSMPGSTGTDYRWTVAYDPVSSRVTSCSLTDFKTAESFSLTDVTCVDVLMGDCYYGRAPEIHRAQAVGACCLCRVYLPQIHLRDLSGTRIDTEHLRKLDEKKKLPEEIEVLVPWKGEEIHARLLICPLPEVAANKAREKVKKAASKKGGTATAERLWLASYWFMITTLDCELIDPRLASEIYRVRWQVEIFFKRAKSLHNLSDIRKAREALERVQILLITLFIMIVQRHIVTDWNGWCVKGHRGKYAPMPSSVWRQAVLLHAELTSKLTDGIGRLGLTAAERKALAERPRRRRYSCEALSIFCEAVIPQTLVTSGPERVLAP